MQVDIVNPTTVADWDQIIAAHPHAYVFHTAGWARVLSETYGHKPFYLCSEGRGEPMTIMPVMEVSSAITGRRGISLPFSDFCSPLLDGRERSDALFSRLCDVARERRWKYLEIRDAFEPANEAKAAKRFNVHQLDLRDGLEMLLTKFAAPIRRGIRKAEGSGLKARVSREEEAVSSFYALHTRTRRRHGLPPQPISFFRNIWRHLIKTGSGFVVLAEMGSRSVAGAMFFRTGRNGLYKFGASDERFQQHRPNNMVMWEGIQRLVDDGAETLHFGRSAPENEGLNRFKRSWGAREASLAYYRFDPAGGAWLGEPASHRPSAENIFRHLPLAVNRLIGAICYPHLD